MVVPKYSTAAMVDAMTRLRELLASREEARKAPRILAEAGVRLVVVESLTGAKIDGACFWLDDRSPVIGLSLRFDRIDNFWFVLRHECEHVLRGDGRTTMILDVELEKERGGIGGDLDAQELAANRAAAEFCVPQKTLQQFIARKAPIFTERDILAFAKMINVHPGLVAGQLQRSTSRYERFRNHLTKIRDVVLPNVLHDGWGDVAPVELSP
jgi:HTH-type transcriptional regulator/antitoxin HigA